jgi:hypothetical protein
MMGVSEGLCTGGQKPSPLYCFLFFSYPAVNGVIHSLWEIIYPALFPPCPLFYAPFPHRVKIPLFSIKEGFYSAIYPMKEEILSQAWGDI